MFDDKPSKSDAIMTLILYVIGLAFMTLGCMAFTRFILVGTSTTYQIHNETHLDYDVNVEQTKDCRFLGFCQDRNESTPTDKE